jgi:chitooligosaccharide deacetylase
MWLFVIIASGAIAAAHMLPVSFLLDLMGGERAVWSMPADGAPRVYLTYDDGPNARTTPDLLDVLAREGVPATFFLIDDHLTEETAPIVRRMFDEGHSVGLHSSTRGYLLLSGEQLADRLLDAADRIERLAGARPCRAFRPHAGWRSSEMFDGLERIDYRLFGWGWMLWDWNWTRDRTARATFDRISERAGPGDIIVMHDGDESAPDVDQRHTVQATARLIPTLRGRGLEFGTVCSNGG